MTPGEYIDFHNMSTDSLGREPVLLGSGVTVGNTNLLSSSVDLGIFGTLSGGSRVFCLDCAHCNGDGPTTPPADESMCRRGKWCRNVAQLVITCFTFALYTDFFRPCEDKSTSLDEAAPQQEREKRVMKLFRLLLNMYERLVGNQMSSGSTPQSHRVSRSPMK